MKSKNNIFKIIIVLLIGFIIFLGINSIDNKKIITKINDKKITGDVINASKFVKGNEILIYEVRYTPIVSNEIDVEAKINSIEYANFKDVEDNNIISNITKNWKGR